MKCTLSWLRNYIECDLPTAKLVQGLVMAGLEVDSCQELFEYLNDSVRIVRIKSVRPHPQADRLVLCDVDAGGERVLRIVCGAPNARPGLLTVLALPGTSLPNGVIIKQSKIRGEISEGMLCSEKDLGISENNAGIIDLPDSYAVGEPLVDALDLHDTLLEVDITPNRPDCASVIGIAREIAGFAGKKLRVPVAQNLPALTGQNLPFSVAVDSAACPRYSARLLNDVTIAPSPWWLKKILLAVGLRPINNVVDITNFVMLEFGQPLHAFDFDRLAGAGIIVRQARPLEKINTLDGVARQLDPEMLVICDHEKPVAVAGIMGGSSSEVTASTKRILLESAYFDPVSIRRTVRKLNMSTDSSYRFERGVDPEGIPKALERAVQLIVELTGAKLVDDGIDLIQGLPEKKVIKLRVQRVSDLLGINISAEEIERLLLGIEIIARQIDELTFEVVPPTFRVDLEREIDLIEEIARLKGYNELPSTLPVTPMSFPENCPVRSLRDKIAATMVALGFYEAINYSFVSDHNVDLLGLAVQDKRRQQLRLKNPLAEDQNVMRTTLLPALLENVRRNINHQTSDLQLFEVGKVFLPQGGELPEEDERLTVVMCGRRYPGAPVLHYSANAVVDIHDIRGVVETILLQQACAGVIFDTDSVDEQLGEAGESVVLRANGRMLGGYGLVARNILKNFGIKQDVYFIDLSISLLSLIPPEPKTFRPLSRYPSVTWDVALVVPEAIKCGELLQAVHEAKEVLFEKVELFDIYQGNNIDKGTKSVALSITYRSADHTLEDDEVEITHKKIINLLISRFQGKLREV